MINSLSKDSHITQSFCLPLQGHVRKEQNQTLGRVATVNNKIGIGINKPTGISFGGLAGAKLAHEVEFQKFVEGVRSFLGDNASLGKTKKLINQAIQAIQEPSKKINKQVAEFLDGKSIDAFNGKKPRKQKENRAHIQEFIEKVNKLFQEDDKGQTVKQQDIIDEKKTIVDASIDGVFGLKLKDKKFYQSQRLKDFLKFASDNKIVFGAFFALFLTCALRPLTIMAMPGDKKNNDDKKYASAHSIASGLIGYVLALGIFGPISKAVKKITDNADEAGFLTDKTKYLLENNKKPLFVAKDYLTMLPDTLVSPPKAIVTIALIPPILKTFFGLEKKKSTNKAVGAPISDNYAAINKNNINNKPVFDNINGGVK